MCFLLGKVEESKGKWRWKMLVDSESLWMKVQQSRYGDEVTKEKDETISSMGNKIIFGNFRFHDDEALNPFNFIFGCNA
ncbi:hypothetical protein Lal_00045909 [Lupinus albus]|nr:hypothetical protein Lal_00045909 [Lupinus albus]